MYIFIFEDGEVKKSKTVSNEDLMSVDDGFLQVIRTEDAKEYYEGEWHDLEEV